jgi:hypothetical protein
MTCGPQISRTTADPSVLRLIHRPPTSTVGIQICAIAAENRIRSAPIRSSAGCTTNTSSRTAVRDAIFADYSGQGTRSDGVEPWERISARWGGEAGLATSGLQF